MTDVAAGLAGIAFRPIAFQIYPHSGFRGLRAKLETTLRLPGYRGRQSGGASLDGQGTRPVKSPDVASGPCLENSEFRLGAQRTKEALHQALRRLRNIQRLSEFV